MIIWEEMKMNTSYFFWARKTRHPHNKILKQYTYKNDTFKFSFFSRKIIDWNNLPPSVTNAASFYDFCMPRCKRVHRVSFSMFSAPAMVSRETDGTGKERKRNKCAFLVKPTTIATRKRMKVGNVHLCTKSNRISDAKTIFWVGELKQSSFLTFLAYVLHSFVRYYNPSYVYDSRGYFFPFTTS